MHREVTNVRWNVYVDKMMVDDQNRETKKAPEAVKLRQVNVL